MNSGHRYRTGGGGPPFDFGDTTQGADDFPCNSDRCLMSRFQCPANASSIASMTGFFAASSTSGCNVKYLIYSDGAGGTAPGSRLGVSNVQAIPAGGGAVTATGMSIDTTLVSGTYYWLGEVTDSFQGQFNHESTGGAADMVMANGTFSYTSPPSTWPGTDASYTGNANVYATCNP